MIRVGFINIFAVGGWLGGLNYLRNLLCAVCALEDRHIEPVLITGRSTSEMIGREFSFLRLEYTSALDRGRPAWLLRKLLMRASGSDPLLARVLRGLGIQILSHSGDLGPGWRAPSLAWIPDLQHRHLPQLFSADEITSRERNIERALDANTRVIVSSETAAGHLRSDDPVRDGKIRVLRFVSGLLHGQPMPASEDLRACYRIESPYLLLPNQFWKHKNHDVVIDALARLKQRGQKVLVLATGLMRDSRHPSHVEALMRKVEERGLQDSFRPLGVVPYADMLGLMRDAVAVINPSLFEGWSTSVEEAKSMGKAVLLSNIPVHIEQDPARSIYFDPHDADAVADAIWSAWSEFDAEADRSAMKEASTQLPARLRTFAGNYQTIVLEALEHSGS